MGSAGLHAAWSHGGQARSSTISFVASRGCMRPSQHMPATACRAEDPYVDLRAGLDSQLPKYLPPPGNIPATLLFIFLLVGVGFGLVYLVAMFKPELILD